MTALALGACTLTACATPVVVNPSWLEQPSPEVLMESYPTFAVMAGFSGKVTLKCIGGTDGRLSGCEVVSATPGGLGFDRATLGTVGDYRLSPRTVDGQAQPSTIQFTNSYRPHFDEEITPWTGPAPSDVHMAAARRLALQLQAMSGGDGWIQTIPLDVDPDREERVRAIITRVVNELRSEELEVGILAIARTFTVEDIEELLRRGPKAPALARRLPEVARTGDQGAALSARREARLRELYCAEFDCGPPLPSQTRP